MFLSETDSNLIDEDASLLLYDINVVLDYEYADPKRKLFPLIAPHYFQIEDSELSRADRICDAYRRALESTSSNDNGLRFRAALLEALARCSNQVLGSNRALMVIDIAHAICPEVFSSLLWRKLLFRQSEVDQPLWLGELAIRWLSWGDSVQLPLEDWKSLLNRIEPKRYALLLEYLDKQIEFEALKPSDISALTTHIQGRLSEESDHIPSQPFDIERSAEILERIAAKVRTRAAEQQASRFIARMEASVLRKLVSDADPDFAVADSDYVQE